MLFLSFCAKYVSCSSEKEQYSALMDKHSEEITGIIEKYGETKNNLLQYLRSYKFDNDRKEAMVPFYNTVSSIVENNTEIFKEFTVEIAGAYDRMNDTFREDLVIKDENELNTLVSERNDVVEKLYKDVLAEYKSYVEKLELVLEEPLLDDPNTINLCNKCKETFNAFEKELFRFKVNIQNNIKNTAELYYKYTKLYEEKEWPFFLKTNRD